LDDALDPAHEAGAIPNILDVADDQQLKHERSALLNILDDFDIERTRAERAYRELAREMAGRKVAEDALQRAKVAEEALRRARDAAEAIRLELERTNAELQSFSYSVAHDLRAPLRAIDGFSRILIEDHADRLGDEGRRVLGVVVTNVAQMGRLVDDLLAFSRLGRASLSLADVDMTTVVSDVAAELQALEPNRAIDIEIGALGHAQCDRGMVRQVWVNLLSNSLKFTRDRATARITIERQDLTHDTVYSIRDNGVGFDMQYQAKLFGVFERLHPSEAFEGTGVGLAIVRRIVERHRGRVWADSVVDEGATFCFTLAPGGEDAK
jgi:light-regulated signal transduction histidine kinase (bacteriophytochrome)